MRTREAITRADELRPNCISAEQKAAWLRELEGEFAELMGMELPENKWPEDQPLLVPAPYDGCYVNHLCMKIDLGNQETEAYANDMVIRNASVREAKAWYRRNNCPKYRGNWRT